MRVLLAMLILFFIFIAGSFSYGHVYELFEPTVKHLTEPLATSLLKDRPSSVDKLSVVIVEFMNTTLGNSDRFSQYITERIRDFLVQQHKEHLEVVIRSKRDFGLQTTDAINPDYVYSLNGLQEINAIITGEYSLVGVSNLKNTVVEINAKLISPKPGVFLTESNESTVKVFKSSIPEQWWPEGPPSRYRFVTPFIPTYCQFRNGQSVRGTFHAVTIIGAAVGAFTIDLKYDSKLSSYNDVQRKYESAIAPEDISKYFKEMKTIYDDAMEFRKWRNRSLLVLAAFWGANIIDSFFFSSIDSHVANANTTEKLFDITATCASIQFSYRF